MMERQGDSQVSMTLRVKIGETATGSELKVRIMKVEKGV